MNTYSKEVAAYLNNKFGDDFTMTEPYPYWMKAPNREEQEEPECWQDCLLDPKQEILEASEEDNQLKTSLL